MKTCSLCTHNEQKEYSQTFFDTGSSPSARQIAEEIGCERSTVARHISALKKAGLIQS
ncbi:helix-turn-helix domain-containing protein [Corynebacterium striatum]|uniref:helix-turn-helix domain-containing protein n=1 Tax=Corynebacterium striatum TaxID=43770 RepID=UPI000E0E0CAD